MIRTRFAGLTLAFMLCMLTSPAYSQEVRGTILGRVTDPQGAVVPAAKLKVINTSTGVAVSVVSNDQGNYQVPYLLVGDYRVEVEAQGFKKYSRSGITVQTADRIELDITLQVGDIAETVTVTAEAPPLETASASMSSTIDARRVAELPTAHGNPYHLMQLSMGVAFTGSPTLDRPFEPSHIANYSMDGGRGLRNELSLDGVPNTSSTANRNEIAAAFVPPADIVAEVKVATATFDATVGQTEGGAVSMSLKSGTNRFTGTAYLFRMSPGWNANDFFANRNGQPRGAFDYNRWGASAGGPVILPKLYDGRNKTFFMYGYEGIKESRPRGTTTTVPTEAERGGDFSALLPLGATYQFYDPATRRAVAGGRFQSDPLPGNIVPKARISPIATNILKYFALPNVPGTADFRNNLQLPTQPEDIDYWTHTFRVDHNISEKQRIFVRANTYERNSNYNNWFGNAATGEWFRFASDGLSFDDVYTFTPTFVMNLRYGYNRFIRNTNGNPESRGFDLTSLGFPASWNNAISPDIRRFPYINISGYYGTNSGNIWRPNDTHAIIAALDKVQGSHALKFGGEFRSYRKNEISGGAAATGQLAFSDAYTRGPLDNSPSAPIGGGLVSFLLGIGTGGSVLRPASFAEQSTVYAYYFQDDWKVSPKLTLTLGLRYEYETPLTERYNRSVTGFDTSFVQPEEPTVKANYAKNPTPEVPPANFTMRGGLMFAGVNGASRNIYNGDKNNFMPRIGATYRLGNKTVIRAGYGMFFGALGVRRGDGIQTGFSQTTNYIASLDGGLSFVSTLANPWPNGILEPVGSALGARTFVGQSISYIQQNPRAANNARWQFGIQRELPHRIMVEAAYVGNIGNDIETSRQLNGIPTQYLSTLATRDQDKITYMSTNMPSPYYPLLPGTGRASSLISRASLLTAYPHFTGLTTTTNEGYSNYHALQMRADKRFSHGYTLQATYTWAKTMAASGFLNEMDPEPYYQIADFDIPHRISLSGIYELPFGKGRSIGPSAPKWANYMIGGWQVQAIWSWQTGTPLGWGNIIYYGDIKNIPLSGDQQTIYRWFNTDNFERNTAKALSYNLRTWPNRFAAPRNPGINNWDMSILKNTNITERVNLQIRAETLNTLNHPMFNGPNTDPYNTAFGQITTSRGYARRVQLGLKAIW